MAPLGVTPNDDEPCAPLALLTHHVDAFHRRFTHAAIAVMVLWAAGGVLFTVQQRDLRAQQRDLRAHERQIVRLQQHLARVETTFFHANCRAQNIVTAANNLNVLVTYHLDLSLATAFARFHTNPSAAVVYREAALTRIWVPLRDCAAAARQGARYKAPTGVFFYQRGPPASALPHLAKVGL